MAIQYKLLSKLGNSRYWRMFALLCVFVLGAVQSGYASHAMGADITYECLGNNQYRITLSYYRDCAGINASASHSLTLGSANCGVTLPNFTVTQDPTRSAIDVSQLCPAQMPQNRCNGGTLPGVQLYTYTAIITLPQGCTDWRIGFSECCRNNAVTNMTNASSDNIYVEATINNQNGLCNNSPQFTTLPVPYICAGQPFNFNHGAIDQDGDTLIYELITPLRGPGNNMVYAGGLSANQPLNTNPPASFVFNTATGQMTFTPTAGQSQVALVAVRVTEIRNGQVIGTTIRDIQVVVLNNCSNQVVVPNQQPLVNVGGSFDPTTRTFQVCRGTNLIFQFGVSDPDATDSLLLNPSNTNVGQLFPGSSVLTQYPVPGRTDTMNVFVSVVTSNVTPGFYSFTIGVRDNACPVPGNQTLGFNIAIPGIEVTAQDTVVCPGVAQNVPLSSRIFTTNVGPSPGTFTWVQVSGPVSPLNDPTLANPIVQIPASTVDGQDVVYSVVFSTVPDPITGVFCTTSDTVVISLRNLPLDVTLATPDTSLCSTGQINLVNFTSTVSGPGVDVNNGVYTWTSTPANRVTDLSSTNTGNPTATISGQTRGDSIVYRMNFNYGTCAGSDSVVLRFRNGQIAFNPVNPVLCAGDTLQLSATLTDSFRTVLPVDCNTYDVQQIPYQAFPTTGPTVASGDDILSPPINFGFDFNFFCNTYNQFIVGSNGFVTFAGTTGSGCCSGQVLPNAAAINNLIAFAWTDLNPGSGGNITWSIQGTAPNRFAVVSFNNVVYFGGGLGVNGQIVMYEGTNVIEIYTNSVTNNTRVTTQGIENATGTVAYPVPGRNGVVWNATTAQQTGWRFTPVSPITFDPISYQWSPPIGLSNDTIHNPQVFTNATQTYTVTLTEGPCVLVDSLTVTLQSTLPAPTISCGIVQDPNSNVGFVWNAVPGAVAWEYSLDSGRTWILRPLLDTTFTVTGLPLGGCATFYVRAVGGSGPCTRNAAAVLTCCTQACEVNYSPSTVTAASCHSFLDGQIAWTLSSTGAGAPYNYTLFNALTGQQVATGTETTNNLNLNVGAGTYYVQVFDAIGCPGTSDTVVVGQPAPLAVQVDNVNPTSCYNTTDGSITVSVNNGTAPYNFIWSAGGSTTNTANNLAGGTYELTVTDANGCTNSATNLVVTTPFNGQAPVVTTSLTGATDCINPNGQISITGVQNMTGNATPPGAAGSLSYAWSNGINNALQITGLTAGGYSVTITDVNACVYVETFSLPASSVDASNATLNNPDCGLSNGSITALPTGSSAFTYLWSNGQTTQTATGLAGGTYIVTVTTAGNCTATGSFTLSAGDIAINVSAIQERVCIGGTTGFVNVNSTQANTSYLWSNGATTANIANLGAGTYTLTATAQTGGVTCSATLSATIREPNQAFSLNMELTRPLDCSGAAIASVASRPSGGWGNNTFTWNNGGANIENTNLAAGMYYVTVTDEEGCVLVDSIEVPAVQVPRLDAWIQAQGQDTAAVPEGLDVDINAGFNQAGVTYQWLPTTLIAAPQQAATMVKAEEPGTFEYIVIATAGGCSVSDTVVLVVLPVALREFPNAFTPNGDGQNDFFRPVQASNVEVRTFQVFNRWGQKVYDNANDYNTGWDGSYNGAPQPRDAYMFVFEYRFPGQTEYETIRGEVTLIR